MKKNPILLWLIAVFSIACTMKLYAQVEVSTGGPTAFYTTLKSAFDSINSGFHTGAIVIHITGNTTESVTASINASGIGNASYTSIHISPSGGGARVISGSISGPLIDLNGADNVTFDGLNTDDNSLTLSNGGISSASTVRFFGDATHNTLTNCTLLGSTSQFGVIYFGFGAVTGNDDNTVNNCDIGPAGANNPVCGIYSMGVTGVDNSNNTISGNRIFDYYNAGVSTSGININSYNSAWTISGNKLFQTSNRVFTTASVHYGINITSGDNYTITDNIIGFANASGSGTTNLVGLSSGSLGGTFPSAYTVSGSANATKYIAIFGGFTTGGIPSSIQNNIISGFALYTSSSTSSTYGIFCAIGVASGNVNIGTITGNKIGTATSSIYTACTSSGGAIAGIYVTSSNVVNIKNNFLQNLDAMGTSASAAGSINGINTEGDGGTFVIAGNTIGNTNNPNLRTGNLTTGTSLSNVGTTFTSGSGSSLFQGIRNTQKGTVTIGTQTEPNVLQNVVINSTSTATALFRGIYCTAGTLNISYNTIRNISSPSGASSYNNGGLAGIGILLAGSSSVPIPNATLSNNTISGLSLTNTGSTGYTLGGIVCYIPNTTSMTISKNMISGLSNASTSVSSTSPGTATGIFIRDGGASNFTIDNNMISLGSGQAGNTTYIGIWPQGGSSSSATTMKIYYNTIHIEGTVTSGAQPSMCLQRGDLAGLYAALFTLDCRNNIFENLRTGGTGKHYTLANGYGSATSTATGWGVNATNYNILNGNSATIGYWTGDQSFNGWKTASSCDANSLTGIPVTFVNVSSGDLHLNMGTTPTALESAVLPIASFTTDIDNDTRPGPVPSRFGGGSAPDPGADEFDGVPMNLPPVVPSGTVTDATCHGTATGAIALSTVGGVAPYTYNWSNGGSTSSITGLTAGSYSVTVTDFISNTGYGSWTVNEPDQIVLTGTMTPADCPIASDGSISLEVSGGTAAYQYAWSIGAYTQNIQGLTTGTYSVTVTDQNQCVKTGSWSVTASDSICNNLTITGTESGTVCHNAHLTITVTNYTLVAPAGQAEFIANQNILFEPETHIESGSYLWAHISDLFCSVPERPLVAVAGTGEKADPWAAKAPFILFPNPTSGTFTLAQKGEAVSADCQVEMFNMQGARVLSTSLGATNSLSVDASALPAGIYFVKITGTGTKETIKVMITR